METPEEIKTRYAPPINESPKSRRRRLENKRAAKRRYFERNGFKQSNAEENNEQKTELESHGRETEEGMTMKRGREESKESKERHRIRAAEYRANLSPTKRAQFRERERIKAAERRASMTPSERERYKERNRISAARRRANLSPSKHAIVKEKERIRTALRRRSLPLLENEKEDNNHSALFLTHSETQSSVINQVNQSSPNSNSNLNLNLNLDLNSNPPVLTIVPYNNGLRSEKSLRKNIFLGVYEDDSAISFVFIKVLLNVCKKETETKIATGNEKVSETNTGKEKDTETETERRKEKDVKELDEEEEDDHLNYEIIGKGVIEKREDEIKDDESSRVFLLSSILKSLKEYNISSVDIESICLCIPNVLNNDERNKFKHQIKKLFYDDISVHVFNDVLATLASATSGKLHGCVLISDLGFIAYGANSKGESAQASGLGPLGGDKASGYSISMDAISSIMRAHDGRGESTSLTQTILHHLHLTTCEEILRWAYSQPGWKNIGSLSPLIMQCASEGDVISQNIMQDAFKEMMSNINSIVKKLHLSNNKENFPLVLSGSTFEHLMKYDMYKIFLIEIMHLYPNAHIINPEVEPALGSAFLAYRKWNELQKHV